MEAGAGSQTGIFDRSDAAYPILARMLATRRDNIKDTITALEQRLSKLDQASWSLI
jgi:phage shock protein A